MIDFGFCFSELAEMELGELAYWAARTLRRLRAEDGQDAID